MCGRLIRTQNSRLPQGWSRHLFGVLPRLILRIRLYIENEPEFVSNYEGRLGSWLRVAGSPGLNPLI